MRIGVPKEVAEGERRVALVPDAVRRLVADGVEVAVEADAGTAAGFADEEYAETGAQLVDAGAVWGTDLVAKVQRPLAGELDRLRSGSILVALLQPLAAPEVGRALAERGEIGRAHV